MILKNLMLDSSEKVIHIKAGVYCVEEKINISNVHGKKYVFDPGAVVCGAKKVTVQWETYTDAILVAQLEKDLPVDGIVINGKLRIMARYPNYQENVPLGGTVGIAEYAFSKSDVTSISFTGELKHINNFAFWQAPLKEVVLPDSLETVGTGIFHTCTELITITVPFAEGELPVGWSNTWNNACNANIVYAK